MPSSPTRASSGVVIAVDIGGTKVAGALVTRRGQILARLRQPTALASAQALVDQVVNLAYELSGKAVQPVTAIGVAVAGVVDPENDQVIWAPNLTDWRDIPLGSVLRQAFSIPTAVAYDGHAAVLGEQWRGAGRGARNVVFLIIGTGVGGGLVLDGRLYRGCSNIAGAAGWLVVDAQQAQAPAERTSGALESVASGPALIVAAERALGQGAKSMIHPPVTTYSILAAADAGDSLARSLLARAAWAVGCAVVGVVSLLNPDVVILGGGLGTATSIYADTARQAVEELAQPVSARAVRIVQAELGDDALLLGAARLALRRDRTAASSSRVLSPVHAGMESS